MKMALNGGKRIAKRSVIGSTVCVLGEDSIWRQGVVTHMRSNENRLIPVEKRFKVQLVDLLGSLSDKHYREDEIFGPGFLSALPDNIRLQPGQDVFVTHSGREVKGTVVCHLQYEDCVTVRVERAGNIIKRLEDIRLLESRKSARLVNSDTDFSRLADFNIVEQRKILREGQSRRRLHSMSSFPDRRLESDRSDRMRRGSEKASQQKVTSSSIDMPVSRKRRTSDSRSDMESGYSSSYGSSFLRSGEDLRECTAALVLMNLSVSPHDRWKLPPSSLHSSPTTYSDCSTPHTPKPSPSTSLTNLLIDEDYEEPVKRQKSARLLFECTWRGCRVRDATLQGIERHVRQHLGRPAEPGPESERDFEEEFYYTEIEDELDMISADEIMEADVIVDNSGPFAHTIPIPTNSNSSHMTDGESQGLSAPTLPLAQLSPASENSCHKQSDSIFISGPREVGKQISSSPSLSPASSSSSSHSPYYLASSAPPQYSAWSSSSQHPSPSSAVAPTTPTATSSTTALHSGFDPHKAISEHLDMVKSPPHSHYSSPPHPYQLNHFNNRKLVSIIPRPESSSTSPTSSLLTTSNPPSKPFIFSAGQAGGHKMAGRNDKKCRKVYGIEQKEMWCTQCKWKKACARFT